MNHNSAPVSPDHIEQYEKFEDIGYAALGPIYEAHIGHEAILGSDAVADELDDIVDEAEDLKETQRNQSASENVASSYKRRSDMRLDGVRQQIKGALSKDPSYQEDLEHYLKTEDGLEKLPKVFTRWREKAGSESWSRWLTKDATLRQLSNFIQWHNHRMVEVQHDPLIIRWIEKQRQDYKSGIQQAIANGDLPEVANDAVSRVDAVDVRIGDIFDTIMKERTGYAPIIGDHIVVHTLPSSKLIKHEFNHVVLGSLPYRWLNEAMTEHIAQSLEHGDFERLDIHGKKWGSYEDERTLVNDLGFMIDEFADGSITPGKNPKGQQQLTLDLITAYADPDMRQTMLDKVDENLKRTLQGMKPGLQIEGSVLEAIDKAITKYSNEFVPEAATNIDAKVRAVRKVQSDLWQQPEVLFEKAKEPELVTS